MSIKQTATNMEILTLIWCCAFIKKEQDIQDRKRQDMQDDKALHIELTGTFLRCCLDKENWSINVYIILIILPLAILHIMFFLEVAKHVVSEFLNIFCLSLNRYKITVKVRRPKIEQLLEKAVLQFKQEFA